MQKKELTLLWKSVLLYGVVNKSPGNPDMKVQTDNPNSACAPFDDKSKLPS